MHEKYKVFIIGSFTIIALFAYLFSTVEFLTPMASLEAGNIQYSNAQPLMIIATFAYIVPMLLITFIAIKLIKKNNWISI